MVLVFQSRSSFNAIKADIVVTPDLEDGCGPVAIGEPTVEAAPGTRCAVSYPWSDVDGDWLAAYTSGENPAVQILDALPADWKHPVAP